MVYKSSGVLTWKKSFNNEEVGSLIEYLQDAGIKIVRGIYDFGIIKKTPFKPSKRTDFAEIHGKTPKNENFGVRCINWIISNDLTFLVAYNVPEEYSPQLETKLEEIFSIEFPKQESK